MHRGVRYGASVLALGVALAFGGVGITGAQAALDAGLQSQVEDIVSGGFLSDIVDDLLDLALANPDSVVDIGLAAAARSEAIAAALGLDVNDDGKSGAQQVAWEICIELGRAFDKLIQNGERVASSLEICGPILAQVPGAYVLDELPTLIAAANFRRHNRQNYGPTLNNTFENYTGTTDINFYREFGLSGPGPGPGPGSGGSEFGPETGGPHFKDRMRHHRRFRHHLALEPGGPDFKSPVMHNKCCRH